MKFKVETTKIAQRLGLIQGIAEKRVTIPILSHVLVCASNEKISFTATDLETTMTTHCEGKIIKEGSIALPARKLFEIVKELPLQGEIEIEEISNYWTQIKTQNATFKIAGLPAEDFPTIPQIPIDDLFYIESQVLDDMIGKTVFAISSDDLRRSLSGIYIESGEDRVLRLVATDGHRLSLVERPAFERSERHALEQSEGKTQDDMGLQKGVIIPKKGVLELRKIAKLDDYIRIGCSKNNFVAQGNGISLIIRLIDAEFPNYRQVIPENTNITLHIRREEFLSALRRVSIFSIETTRAIKMGIENGIITLSSVSPELGEAKEIVPIDYTGDSIELGFNARYLMDVLEATSEDMVQLGIIDQLNPVLIKPVSDTKEQLYLSVIMPMRV